MHGGSDGVDGLDARGPTPEGWAGAGLTLVQVRAFEAVVRSGTFTGAAEQLFLTQPSLSRQISALESELGVTLFSRGRGGARLTVAGERLLPIARRMLADATAAHEEMAEVAGARRGRVRLGSPPTLCVSVVAEVLAAFTAQHPDVDLEITEAGSHALASFLAEGGLDLALTVERGPVDASVVSTALFVEELVVASGVDSPWASGERVTLAQLARMPQVSFNRSYDLRQATDAAFAAAGLRPAVAVEGAEMDAVLRFVERGLGVAVVPATILLGRPGLRAARLVRPSLTRTVALSERGGARLDPAGEAMRATVLATVSELMAPDGALGELLGPA